MTLTAKIGKRGQMTLPRDVRIKHGLEEGQSVAFVVKNGELALVPLRKTFVKAIREQVAADQVERVVRGE